MPTSPSGVEGSSSLPPQGVAAEVAASSPSGQRSVGEGGVSKAALVIWKKLSANLAENPSANWNEALSTADELARSVCGQDLPADLQADLLENFKLLEKTLTGLSISPSESCPDPQVNQPQTPTANH